MTGEYGPQPQLKLDGNNKVQFDITTERDTFFEAHKALERNPGKTPIFGMPSAFDSSLEAGIL